MEWNVKRCPGWQHNIIERKNWKIEFTLIVISSLFSLDFPFVHFPIARWSVENFFLRLTILLIPTYLLTYLTYLAYDVYVQEHTQKIKSDYHFPFFRISYCFDYYTRNEFLSLLYVWANIYIQFLPRSLLNPFQLLTAPSAPSACLLSLRLVLLQCQSAGRSHYSIHSVSLPAGLYSSQVNGYAIFINVELLCNGSKCWDFISFDEGICLGFRKTNCGRITGHGCVKWKFMQRKQNYLRNRDFPLRIQ